MKVIDSHTEGEPTRVIISGGPDLGDGPLSERLQRFRAAHDDIRRTAVLEPRGSDVLVGAWLCPPQDQQCATGVIFFNNSGYLGMCGHGIMGVAATLKALGQIDADQLSIETPVGVVHVEVLADDHYRVENVSSHVYRQDVSLPVESLGQVTGDVAWGGNWFFLTELPGVALQTTHISRLTTLAQAVKQALTDHGITGADGAPIDHIEFFARPDQAGAHSKNFVLCPGDAYDRSPCGTGTSAKIACLEARGLLQPGELWIQDSIIDSRFVASYRYNHQQQVIPSITGRAFVTAHSTLLRAEADPFRHGI